MNKEQKIENWTEVITSKRFLFDLNLKELWRYRDLIILFVHRDFISIYKQTILGPLWLFIKPLFSTIIFFIIFTKVAKIPTADIDPILFYLSGITLWNYFSDCFSKTSNIFVSNAGIFGKVYFPRLVSPISIVISNLIKLGVQVLLFVTILLYKIIVEDLVFQANLNILILPYLILLMAVIGLGLGIIFSALTTKYRDLSFLLAFGIQLLMYLTPIIYPLSYTEGKFHTIISLNPLTSIMESFRYAFFGIGSFDWSGLAYASIFGFVVLFIGIVIFNQVEKSFMDSV